MAAITGRGINQEDLLSLLLLIRTNFVGVTAKLAAEGIDGVSYNFTYPANLANPGIFHQGAVINYLQTVTTQFNGFLEFLDNDGGIADEDYVSLWGMTDYLDNLASGSLTQAGMYDGALVKLIGLYVTNFNGTLTKLDADASVTGTNYNSLWAIPARLVDTTGCQHKPGTGSTIG